MHTIAPPVSDRRKGILFVASAALLWSTGGLGIKEVAASPIEVTFYRSLFAAIALGLILRRSVWGRRWRSTPIFLFAIVSYGACLTTFVVATKLTAAANAIFLQYAGVVWVLLLSPLVGMGLFFVGRLDTNGMDGNVMALLSSVFFAGLVLALRRENDAAQSAVTWGNALLALVLFPFISHTHLPSARSLTVLVFLGIVQIAAAYALFVRGLRYITATQASLTGMIEPIANPIWVLLVLGERPSPFAIGGAAVVLSAIGWHTLTGNAPIADLPAPD
jgi:drug/metabolite transporter (DMT)-like permease